MPKGWPYQNVRGRKPTIRQLIFVEEYARDWDGGAAYLRAGYRVKDKRWASDAAARLLSHPHIAYLVDEKRKALAKAATISAERTLEELRRVAFFDFRKLFHPDGTLKQPKEMDEDTASVVSFIEVFEEYQGNGKKRKLVSRIKKVRLWDKLAALQSIGKNLGLFKEIQEHRGSIEHVHQVDSRLLVMLDVLPLEVKEQMLERLKSKLEPKQLENKSDGNGIPESSDVGAVDPSSAVP